MRAGKKGWNVAKKVATVVKLKSASSRAASYEIKDAPKEPECTQNIWLKQVDEAMETSRQLRVELREMEQKYVKSEKALKEVTEGVQRGLSNSNLLCILGLGDAVFTDVAAVKVASLEKTIQLLSAELSCLRSSHDNLKARYETLAQIPSFDSYMDLMTNRCKAVEAGPYAKRNLLELLSELKEIKNTPASQCGELWASLMDKLKEAPVRYTDKCVQAAYQTHESRFEKMKTCCTKCGAGPFGLAKTRCSDCGTTLDRSGTELCLWQGRTSHWLRRMINLKKRTPAVLSAVSATLCASPSKRLTAYVAPPLPLSVYKDTNRCDSTLSMVGVNSLWSSHRTGAPSSSVPPVIELGACM